MNRLLAKLKSKSGASLLLVLVLFFLCVMISSVIVVAAASGASLNANRKKPQQGYLSITSAVQLAIKEMEGSGKFVGREETKDYGCNASGIYQYSIQEYNEIVDTVATPIHPDVTAESGEDIWSVDMGDGITEQTKLEGAFSELLLAACTAIYDAKQEQYATSFVVSSDDERLADVTCDFSMDKFYNITMKFTAADTQYAMTLTFKGNQLESSEELPNSLDCVHNISYIETLADGSMQSATGTRTLSGKKNIKRTTITWVLPTVTKGVD